MRGPVRSGWALAAAFALFASSARAQNADADGALRRGVELRARGDDEGALTAFRSAYALRPTAHARGQMALAELALGRWAEAEAHLREALEDRHDAWIARHRPTLVEAAATIEGHLGSLEVRGDSAGAEVFLDGRAAGVLPLAAPLRVPAGRVVLEVRAAGYITAQRQVTVIAGQTAREEVALVAVEAPAVVRAPPPPPPPPIVPRVVEPVRSSPLRGLGVAAAGAAVLFAGGGALAFGLREDLVARYNGPECFRLGQSRASRCAPLLREASTEQTLGVVGVVAGGALAVTAVVLLLAAPTHSRQERSAGWGCGAGPGALGLSCAATF